MRLGWLRIFLLRFIVVVGLVGGNFASAALGATALPMLGISGDMAGMADINGTPCEKPMPPCDRACALSICISGPVPALPVATKAASQQYAARSGSALAEDFRLTGQEPRPPRRPPRH